MYSHTTQTHRATCHSSSHPWRGRVAAALAGLALAAFGLPAAAAIPLAERQVLIDLYNSTSGDGWFRNNCKDVVGRDCSAAEKADVLAWLLTLKP